jgi:GMP synthase (glutamine-hydrolysing)
LCSTQNIRISTSAELRSITQAAGLQGWTVPIATVGVQGDYRTFSNLVILHGKADLEKYATVGRRITRELRKTNRVAFVVAPEDEFDLQKAFVRESYIDKRRLNLLREADAICQTMLREEALPDLVWQFPVILVPLTIRGGETIALRPVSSQDFMTAKHSNLPMEFIHRIGRRVLSEVPGIDMVLYDVTDKPPATIEWE